MKSLGVGAEPLFLGLHAVVCEIHPLRNVAIVLPQPTRTHLGIIPIAVLIRTKRCFAATRNRREGVRAATPLGSLIICLCYSTLTFWVAALYTMFSHIVRSEVFNYFRYPETPRSVVRIRSASRRQALFLAGFSSQMGGPSRSPWKLSLI